MGFRILHGCTATDFCLALVLSEILAKIEECIASIQDNAGNGQIISGVVALAPFQLGLQTTYTLLLNQLISITKHPRALSTSAPSCWW